MHCNLRPPEPRQPFLSDTQLDDDETSVCARLQCDNRKYIQSPYFCVPLFVSTTMTQITDDVIITNQFAIFVMFIVSAMLS